MHENERVDSSAGDQTGSNHGLPECRWRAQYALIMGQYLRDRLLLIGPQFPAKCSIDWLPGCALIPQFYFYSMCFENSDNLFQASSWQTDVLREALAAGNNSGLAIGGESHRLSLVKQGILKRGNTHQAIEHGGGELLFFDIEQ